MKRSLASLGSAGQRRLLELEPPPSQPARVLMADPPWQFADKLPGNGRGAAKHYPCMGVVALCAFQLPKLAPDCLLLLWRVAAMQREALQVITAWGFTLKSEIVWCKLSKTGKRHMGMGRYVRAAHETCLVATRGRVTVADRGVRSVFDAPVQGHSHKPDAIYEIAERLVPGGPYVEIFGRRRRQGWTVLGNDPALEAAE